MQWQGPQDAPTSAPRFWAMVGQMLNHSNYRNPGVPTRPMPVGMPQQWQPPVSTNSTADAALKGLPQ